ncbi:hydroxyacylglutathione hydrolase [Pelomicrobium methylotrophicum]|uniref:hydroxyacylglutathione hydrolase n=1 Tax=Pelomicrobium methylotrophicum TaxID=2602750 RepID=UPI001969BDD9|nr:hydroxyacylglutathione hydrolase [Pelomicrobium methylotrophicum]
MVDVVPVPAFNDNYIWVLHDGQQAVAVDPGDAAPVFDFLERQRLRLAAILVTHHHGDHVGGIPALLHRHRVPVYGPRGESISTVTCPLAEGDRVCLPALELEFGVLEVPGHTAGHIAYYGHGRLFCGDTLFACGCGRLFEGTASQMYRSLEKLAALPGDTRVYCAHEYTLSNIRFAKAADPHNPALLERERREKAVRERLEPTLPSTIALERATNPFLRCTEPAVQATVAQRHGRRITDPVEVFAALRAWKNEF